MNDLVKQTPPPVVRGLSSRSLAKLIFSTESPEQFVRTLPAQSLYMAIKQGGMDSSADLIGISTVPQCRLLLDFDCWNKSEFQEDNFWEWLAVTDADHSLELLQKVLKCLDLKLVALLISRYVLVQANEEPSDAPPDAGYYTPDKGNTWLKVETNSSDRDFLLARLLAMIFETNADLFYQLLAIPGVTTPTMLEEESYQDKRKRLTAEGIPDDAYAYELNSPLEACALIKELKTQNRRPDITSISAIEPLIYDSAMIQPLGGLLQALPARENFETELTLIMNAAIVHWNVEMYEYEHVFKLTEKVKGAINIGLESVLRLSQYSSLEIYEFLGLQKLYAHGLSQILPLRKQALKISDEKLVSLGADNAACAIVAGLREPFPEMPIFFAPDGTLRATADGALEKGFKALESLQEVASLKKVLEDNL
jgi:hypothetical protein